LETAAVAASRLIFKRFPNDSLTKAAPHKLIRKYVPVAGTDVAVF
jgi:hypothetical protein